MSRRKLMWMPALAALLFAGACEFGGTNPTGQAGLTILLTDAPHAGLQSAQVNVDRITLQGDGGEVVLLDEPTGWIDLHELAGEKTATLIQDAIVPAGLYHQMRFVIREAFVTDSEGRVFATGPAEVEATGTLQCASCETPGGLRVKLDGGGVELGVEAKILLVEFDVSESLERVGRAGASPLWVMTPLLWATDFQATGTIRGDVALGEGVELPAAATCGDNAVSLATFLPRIEDGDFSHNGVTDDDGSFVIAFVPPGSYDLTYKAEVELDGGWSAEFEADASDASATVTSGQETSASYTITAVGCVQESSD
jgi:hypothetical protein